MQAVYSGLVSVSSGVSVIFRAAVPWMLLNLVKFAIWTVVVYLLPRTNFVLDAYAISMTIGAILSLLLALSGAATDQTDCDRGLTNIGTILAAWIVELLCVIVIVFVIMLAMVACNPIICLVDRLGTALKQRQS